uniref:VWA domain-containing protein n=1 Tax=Desulfobacca acetoxidans TaxID=60893 RepID=A0A7V4G718_9BACT
MLKTFASRCIAWLAAALALMLLSLDVHAAPQPINKVVVMVDTSGSYKGRQMEAIQKASQLLDAMSQSKIHRWEKGVDQIFIVSLDAMPEVIWQGLRRELKTLDRNEWIARFKARTDYSKCTDIGAGFVLAANLLEGDSKYVKKYLFAFTDLVDEPPMDSIWKCKKPRRPSLPPETFPWENLQDVSVSVFWAPPDQKLAWARIAKEKGVATFAIHTTSESAQVKLAPPPKARVTFTEEEVQANRARYAGIAGSVATWGLYVVLGFVFLAVIIGLAGRRRGNGPPSRRPGPGMVPPLRRPLPGSPPQGARPPQTPGRSQQH